MFWAIKKRGINMIRDLIWKTYKMEELILEQVVIHLLVEIWAIYFKCLWEEAWVVWVVEEEGGEEVEDSQEVISIQEVKVKENSSLSDLAEKL
jgi:hypothetical protein